jgi:hypothetical protein
VLENGTGGRCLLEFIDEGKGGVQVVQVVVRERGAMDLLVELTGIAVEGAVLVRVLAVSERGRPRE